jgi:hypothetical protein
MSHWRSLGIAQQMQHTPDAYQLLLPVDYQIKLWRVFVDQPQPMMQLNVTTHSRSLAIRRRV